jgi:hypothetical protein
MDSFKVATLLFWMTFFANQRGCLVKFRDALFAQVISTTADDTLAWLNENVEKCKEVWNTIHDTMLDVFAKQVKEMSESWLESEAGKYYMKCIRDARYYAPKLDDLEANSKQEGTKEPPRTHRATNVGGIRPRWRAIPRCSGRRL